MPAVPAPPRVRTLGTVLAVAAAALIVVATGWPQTHSPLADTSFGHWCLVCGRLGTADVIQNVLLFLPVGAGLGLAGVRPRTAAALGLALSGTMELVQLTGVTGGGRFATISDLVTNTAGAWLGAAVAIAWPVWLVPSRRAARRLAAGAAAAWLAVLAGATWAFGRDPAPGPTPPEVSTLETTPEMGWFAGLVPEARFGALRVARRGSGAVIVHAATGRSVAGEVTQSGSDRRPFGVPMLYVHGVDPTRAELVIGQVGRAAVVSVHLRAGRLRLRQPSIRMPDTFGAGEGPASGIVRRISGRYADRVLRVSVEGPGGARTRTLPLTGATAWALVVPFVRPDGSGAGLLTALWVAAVLGPLGYWLGCGERGAPRGGLRAGLAAAAVVAVGLWGLPAVAGAPPTPAWVWLAAIAAAATGVATAASVCRRAPGNATVVRADDRSV